MFSGYKDAFFIGQILMMDSLRLTPFNIWIVLIIVFGMSAAFVSCKKSEDVEVVKKVKSKKAKRKTPKDESLAQAMKKASLVMRRLSRAVENNDWVEIDMWAQELKEGIGYNCVELYMNENPGISSDFIILGNKFYKNINSLILASEEHLKPVTEFQFSMIIKTCDDCHKRFFEEMGRERQFTDQVRIDINRDMK